MFTFYIIMVSLTDLSIAITNRLFMGTGRRSLMSFQGFLIYDYVQCIACLLAIDFFVSITVLALTTSEVYAVNHGQ